MSGFPEPQLFQLENGVSTTGLFTDMGQHYVKVRSDHSRFLPFLPGQGVSSSQMEKQAGTFSCHWESWNRVFRMPPRSSCLAGAWSLARAPGVFAQELPLCFYRGSGLERVWWAVLLTFCVFWIAWGRQEVTGSEKREESIGAGGHSEMGLFSKVQGDSSLNTFTGTLTLTRCPSSLKPRLSANPKTAQM